MWTGIPFTFRFLYVEAPQYSDLDYKKQRENAIAIQVGDDLGDCLLDVNCDFYVP